MALVLPCIGKVISGIMVTREDILAEIQRVPEEHLDEVYSFLKRYEQNGEESARNTNVMAKLREIKISASPDLSIRANLHDLKTPDAE
jgi:hypothetical protein